MALPLQLPWPTAQTRWKSQLDPILANPTTNLTLLKGVTVQTGTNVINHLLQQVQQGWVVLDSTAAITLYRSAPFNSTTLTLTASGPATITLGVF
jgi:hypothetical protein